MTNTPTLSSPLMRSPPGALSKPITKTCESVLYPTNLTDHMSRQSNMQEER